MNGTLVDSDNVQEQMEVLRNLALLFSQVSDNRGLSLRVKMACSSAATAFNKLSLEREIIPSPVSIQAAAPAIHRVYVGVVPGLNDGLASLREAISQI